MHPQERKYQEEILENVNSKQFGFEIVIVFFQEKGVYTKMGGRLSILQENSPIFF